MEIIIKQETIEEAARKIFDLDQKIFIEPLSFPSKDIKEIVNAFKNCIIQIAYEGNKVVGFSAHEKRDDGTVLIKSVGILPDSQHNGIGTKLMEKIISETNGCILQLHTHPQNKQAVQFYWKLGLNFQDNALR